MATVVKNFRIKSGLVVEGTTGTINGQNILTESGADSYILNLVGGATLVKSVESTQLEVNGAGKLSVKSGVFDAAGAAAAAQSAAEATASADATTKANAAASSAISAASTDATTKVAAEAALRVSGDAASVSTAAADATSKANAAQAAAEATASADATSKANAAQSAAISAAATDATTKANAAQSAAATDATTKANAAQAAAEATAAAALSSAISTEVSNRNTAISTAVDSLVDGAPALLNTLNELAAAINDDANYTTTITTALGTKANSADVTAALAGKEDALTAAEMANKVITAVSGASYGLVGTSEYLDVKDTNGYNKEIELDIAAVEAKLTTDGYAKQSDIATAKTAAEATAAADATSKANAAQSAAAADATSKANAAQAAAEATAAAANTAQQEGTTAFTALNVNDQAKQIAASSTGTASVAGTAYQWAKADYRSAKLLVKIDNATHNEISEILLTLDASDNVAITEYAIVGTNGSRGTITAEVSGANVLVKVTPTDNSTVKVSGTLLK